MLDNVLGTAKEFMRESEAIFFVCCLGLHPTLPHNPGQILPYKNWLSGGVLSTSEREEFFNECCVWYRLVGLQRRIKS